MGPFVGLSILAAVNASLYAAHGYPLYLGVAVLVGIWAITVGNDL